MSELHKKYVAGGGSINPKLMIIGDCPSVGDAMAERPFSDTAGRELDKILREAGTNRSEVWLTNVSKYHVPPAAGKKKQPFHTRATNVGIDIDKQLADLQAEVNAVKPNCILTLGKGALWAMNGKQDIKNFRGSILMGMSRKFVPTYHPDNLTFNSTYNEFKGYYNRQIMVLDTVRALKQSAFPDIRRPNRTLEICRNSSHLHDFLNRYKDKVKVSVDIEAGGHCLPICIGLAFSKSHGMTVPLWNTDGISNIPDADMVSIWLLVAQALDKHHVIGQNFNYDRDKIKRLGFKVSNLLSDLMLKSFTINPELPKGLAFNTSIYTEEPFYKDEGMYEGKLSDLLIGCARDACVTFEIDEIMEDELEELHLKKFFYNFIMTLPDFYWEIEQTGFCVNPKKRDALVGKYVQWSERLAYELYQIVGLEVNVNSSQQISSLLFDSWKLPRRKGTGEEELTSLLNLKDGVKNTEHRRAIELILEQRRVRKTISTYLMALPDYDHRMKTTCFPCLETGRSSTGQQDPPIRPMVDMVGKGNKKDMKVMGTAFQTMTKHGDIGSDVREMYEPFPGEIFVSVDKSQAEARVVFLLANDEQALEDIDKHDYHALTASWFFGGTEDDYSKKKLGYESPIRFAGKTLRHAGHLGAKKRRAATELNTQARKYKIPINISEQDADNALKIFHRKQPRIQQVFHNGVIEALKATRVLTAALPWGIDAEHGGSRTFFGRMDDDLFRQSLSYIPQRSVSDDTKASGIRTKKRFPECRIVMEAHDGLLFSVRLEYLKEFLEIVRQEMERPLDFSKCTLPRRKLKIPCEIEVGENYMDLHKWKEPVQSFETEEVLTRPLTITEQFMVDPNI